MSLITPEETENMSTLDTTNSAQLTSPAEKFESDLEIPDIMADEIDTNLIVRPELFHIPGISGLLIPIIVACATGHFNKWLMCLAHKSGRKEIIEPSEIIPLDDLRTLQFSMPITVPSSGTICPWTRDGRINWYNSYTPEPNRVFEQLVDIFSKFLVFPPEKTVGNLIVLSLWTIMTYFYPIWSSIPYLSIGGPAGSGKSRIFDILNLLIFRPLLSSNMTAPCLFRTLHAQGGVLLLDEAERLKEGSPEAVELRSILLAGYKKNGKANRARRDGDDFNPQSFDVYGPKAMACIAGLQNALASRCIPIMMFRAPSDSPVIKRRETDFQSQFAQLRDDLHALALCYGQAIIEQGRVPFSPEGLSARDYEIWQPLYDIACFIENHGISGLTSELIQFAQLLASENQADSVSETDEMILIAAKILSSEKTIGFQAKDILTKLRDEQPGIFGKYSPKGIASTLKKYGIHSNKTGGKKLFNPSDDAYMKIQTTYGMDLGFEIPEPSPDIKDVLDFPGTLGTSGTFQGGVE